MSAIVQVLPRPVENKPGRSQEGTGGGESLEGSAIFGIGNYLPSINNENRDQGGNSGQDGSAEYVNWIGGSGTEEVRSLANRLPQKVDAPLFSRVSASALWRADGPAAIYAEKSINEYSRDNNWGGFTPWGGGRAKFLPLDGKPITFDPNDIGIRFDVPYTTAAKHTTVDEDDYNRVFLQQREAHANQGNPRKDRLKIYSLTGLEVRGAHPTDIA